MFNLLNPFGYPSDEELAQVGQEYTQMMRDPNTLPQDLDECEDAMATLELIPSRDKDGNWTFVDA